MKVGDLIEAHKGERGIVLDVEKIYPRHPDSPIRCVLVHWFDKPPHWHVKGRFAHASGIKRVISSANW
jgi:hypothetical protein